MVKKTPRRRNRVFLSSLIFVAPFFLNCQSEADDGLAKVEDGEWLPGGETTNLLLLGSNAYTRPADNIDPENENAFYSGNSFFNLAWVTAPASTMARDGLGPTFNSASCAGCHFKDGRGLPPESIDDPMNEGALLRVSIPGGGNGAEAIPHPLYGDQIQPFSIDDVPAEAAPRVSWNEQNAEFWDGESYSLREAEIYLGLLLSENEEEMEVSLRVAPAVIGLGLLEAVDPSAFADPEDEDGDGISGRLQMVPDVETGEMAVGRFGWKAGQPTVAQQSAAAFLGDVGITSDLFGENNCPTPQIECSEASDGGSPELSTIQLDVVTKYSQLLSVPVRRRYDEENVLRGKALFKKVGCDGCHIPRIVTGKHPSLTEVSEQVIWPYTDLLLHDMGPGLADGRPTWQASGSEWRTPPLWGISQLEAVTGRIRLMHDGRARNITEAIMWHGGEASDAQAAFEALDASDRNALVDFVSSL